MCIHMRISVFQLGQMQAGKFFPANPASQHILKKRKREKGKKNNFGSAFCCSLLVWEEKKKKQLCGEQAVDLSAATAGHYTNYL